MTPFLEKTSIELFQGEWHQVLGALQTQSDLLHRDLFESKSSYTQGSLNQQIEVLESIRAKIEEQLIKD